MVLKLSRCTLDILKPLQPEGLFLLHHLSLHIPWVRLKAYPMSIFGFYTKRAGKTAPAHVEYDLIN